jgi:hypothetical protein
MVLALPSVKKLTTRGATGSLTGSGTNSAAPLSRGGGPNTAERGLGREELQVSATR